MAVPGFQGIQTVSEPAVQSELSIEEQIADLQDSIEFLESLWSSDPNIQQEIDADDWQQFMDAIQDSLLELQI